MEAREYTCQTRQCSKADKSPKPDFNLTTSTTFVIKKKPANVRRQDPIIEAQVKTFSKVSLRTYLAPEDLVTRFIEEAAEMDATTHLFKALHED